MAVITMLVVCWSRVIPKLVFIFSEVFLIVVRGDLLYNYLRVFEVLIPGPTHPSFMESVRGRPRSVHLYTYHWEGRYSRHIQIGGTLLLVHTFWFCSSFRELK